MRKCNTWWEKSSNTWKHFPKVSMRSGNSSIFGEYPNKISIGTSCHNHHIMWTMCMHFINYNIRYEAGYLGKDWGLKAQLL